MCEGWIVCVTFAFRVSTMEIVVWDERGRWYFAGSGVCAMGLRNGECAEFSLLSLF